MASLPMNTVLLLLLWCACGASVGQVYDVTILPGRPCQYPDRPSSFLCTFRFNGPTDNFYSSWKVRGSSNRIGVSYIGNERQAVLNTTFTVEQLKSTLTCIISHGLNESNTTHGLQRCKPPNTSRLESNASTDCQTGSGCHVYLVPYRYYLFTCRTSPSQPAALQQWLLTDPNGRRLMNKTTLDQTTERGSYVKDGQTWTWSRLTLLAKPEHGGVSVICQIMYPDDVTVHANHSMLLVVVYPPGNVTLEVNATSLCSKGKSCAALVHRGLSYLFTCQVIGLHAAGHITWLIRRPGIGPDSMAVKDWTGLVQEDISERHNDRRTSEISLRVDDLLHNSSFVVCRADAPGLNKSKEAAVQLLIRRANDAAMLSNTLSVGFTALIIFMLVFGCAVFLGISLAVARRSKRRQLTTSKNDVASEDVSSSSEPVSFQLRQYVNIQVSSMVTIFPRERLVLREVLGSGHFGQVHLATAQGILQDGLSSDVAVKFLKESSSSNVMADFQKELKIHQSLLKHPNVVSMLGYCTEKAPFYLIMEYLSGGNLQNYLRGKKAAVIEMGAVVEGALPACPFQMLNFASQVACGMDYLSSMGYIHRDLASRNILLSEDLVCKLSDFGMARDVSETEQYEKTSMGLIPVRWLALECLVENTYTTMSDVWSFGILLWEIITLGAHPYRGMAANQIIDSIVEGYRLPMPIHCTNQLYTVLKECWRICPSRRPTFTDLKKIIDIMIPDATIYLAMEKFVPDKYL